MIKALKLVSYVVFAFILTTALALAASNTFKAKITGKEEVPAVTTAATGYAVFKLSEDGKQITYTLKVKGMENVAAAHIHAGKMGADGGVVVGLFAGPKKEGKFSGLLAKGTIMDKDLVGPLAGKKVADLVTMIKDGGAYVNVHTAKNPKGEIRGQIK
jgi:hypothetical protein